MAVGYGIRGIKVAEMPLYALYFYVEGEKHTNETQSKTNRTERWGKPQGNRPDKMTGCVLETLRFQCHAGSFYFRQ